MKVVDVLDSGDTAHLALLQRPELGVTLTKLHCWTLTQFSKCVFMDADTLVRLDILSTNAQELFIIHKTTFACLDVHPRCSPT